MKFINLVQLIKLTKFHMKALLFTFLICIFFQLYAQDSNTMGVEAKLQFSYDNSGNQIERKFSTINENPLKQSNQYNFTHVFEDRIKVYPNPTKGKFYIEWEKEIASHISMVEVLSTSAIIQTNRIESTQAMLNVDLTSKQSGIYFVRFTFTDGSIVSKKVIKH